MNAPNPAGPSEFATAVAHLREGVRAPSWSPAMKVTTTLAPSGTP